MKILHFLPLTILLASCQQNVRQQQTLPPVVQKKPPAVSKPKKRYSSNTTKPKETEVKPLVVDPTIPDPSKVTPTVTAIPRFEVPENVQPKVPDGINQGEFIELKW